VNVAVLVNWNGGDGERLVKISLHPDRFVLAVIM
jgi:hypothetical protein